LLCSLGTFVQPSLCTECAERKLAKEKPKEKTKKVHHLVVKMPPVGNWQRDERISQWPPHLTYDVIARIEKADFRIVALGDDLTYSAEDPESAWPWLLEQALNQGIKGKTSVAVVNAGVPKSTSRQALVRFPRDVAPFEPHLIIFSFAFADSLLWLNRQRKGWRPNLDPEQADEAAEALCRKLSSSPSRLLYWTTNPLFPRDYVDTNEPEFLTWASEQASSWDHCRRQMRHLTTTYDIATLDLYSRFEVNGVRSAKKWMSNWCSHNEVGARNIATWFSAHILSNNLLAR